MSSHFSFRKFELLDLFLLMAVSGAWLADRNLDEAIESLRFRLESNRSIHPKLRILHEDRLAATKRTPEHFRQQVFDINVPSDGDYSLCIAVGKVGFEPGEVVEPSRRTLLPSGRHTIEIVCDKVAEKDLLVEVRLDEHPLLTYETTTAVSDNFDVLGQVLEAPLESTELENGQPLVLYRYVFGAGPPEFNYVARSATDTKEGSGVLVWCQ